MEAVLELSIKLMFFTFSVAQLGIHLFFLLLFYVCLKELAALCLLGRLPDSVNIFNFRVRLKIKLFSVTSSIIRPGYIASYSILFQK